MESESDRLGLLVELVTLSRPLEATLEALAQQHWDSDAEMVTLDRAHLAAVLRRYLGGDLDATTLEVWANAIELRDDIGLADDDQLLRDLMFELANPEVTAPLSRQRTEIMLGSLSAT